MSEQKTKFNFIKNEKQFPADMDFGQLATLPREIQDSFQSSLTYNIKSDAKIENIESFIDCFLPNKRNKNSEPDFNEENIVDYYNLSKEFEINELTETINKKHADILGISFLKKTAASKPCDVSESEKYISSHLDSFLLKHPNEMYGIPFASLYNIFFANTRKLENEDLAYKFITRTLKTDNDNNNKNDNDNDNKNDSDNDNKNDNDNDNINENDDSLFILLESLNCSNLSDEAVRDCVSKKSEHLGFIPQIDISYLESASKKMSEIESTVEKMKEEQKRQQEKMKAAHALFFGFIKQFDASKICEIRVSGISFWLIKQLCISDAKLETLNLSITFSRSIKST